MIDIGTKINLEKLVDSRALIQANSGGGKSYLLRVLLEESNQKVLAIVLDMEGEYHTLREKFDFLLVGGKSGDIPISLRAASLLPQKILELKIPTIIDLSDLKRQERIFYVRDFLHALMELPKQYWQPCLVILGEAHQFVGQQEKQESTSAVIDLMTRGRKRGFCGILDTQRISKLHKDAAAECNNKFVGRTFLDIDMKRASEELGFSSKEDMLSLRDLSPGEFYAYGVAIQPHNIHKIKIKKAQTTHPKVGMDLSGQISKPTEKIKSILNELNNLPQEAEKQKLDKQTLEKKVRELERELQSKKSPVVSRDPNELSKMKQQGFKEAEQIFKKEILILQAILEKQNKNLQRIKETISLIELSEIPKVNLPKNKNPYEVWDKPIVSSMKPTVHPILASHIDNAENLSFGICEKKILSLLYNNPNREFKKNIVGIFTEYSWKSGGFSNALSKLSQTGLIKKIGNIVQITQEGLSQAPEILGDKINLFEEFKLENWEKNLPKAESKIFSILLKEPDREFSKEEIGELAGYSHSSGGFSNALSRLSSLTLIKKNGNTIKINEEVFE